MKCYIYNYLNGYKEFSFNKEHLIELHEDINNIIELDLWFPEECNDILICSTLNDCFYPEKILNVNKITEFNFTDLEDPVIFPIDSEGNVNAKIDL